MRSVRIRAEEDVRVTRSPSRRWISGKRCSMAAHVHAAVIVCVRGGMP